nr:hypothetical protein [Halomonas socia]
MTSPWPLLITLTYVAIAMVIGLRARGGRRMNSLEEWGVAGRSMGPVTLYLLIAAGSVSAYTFMGAPGWAYAKGVAVFYVAVYLAYLALVAWYFGPKVWQFGEQFGHVTQASAIADRYQSPALGALAALVMSIGSIAYAVLQTVGSAYILFVMSGGTIPVWLGVPLVLACIAVYLFVSGQRAIGRTNAFQGVLMLIVAWAVGLWALHSATGGLSFAPLFERLLAEHGEFLTLPRASRLGVMAGIVAGFLVTVAFTTLWPHPLGVHAGFWGLMLNLPVFVAVSLVTAPTSPEVVERFFRIAAPRGLTRLGSGGKTVAADTAAHGG